jgi:hypothetical protein
MNNLIDYPLLVFALAFFGLWLCAWIGSWFLGKRQKLKEDIRGDFGVIQTTTLTMLGLIIGFTFSMAISRYEHRKNCEEAEAKAIGTQYLRADLLPGEDPAKVRTLLTKYLDLRILFYQTRDEQQLRQIKSNTAQLQSELWSAVRAPTELTPVVALAISGMNDVLSSQGYTQAAWWNRIPLAAWALMAAIGILSNLLVGYSARHPESEGILMLVLPLVVSISFLLIADIDSPRLGVIRAQPQNLLSLAESLHGSN